MSARWIERAEASASACGESLVSLKSARSSASEPFTRHSRSLFGRLPPRVKVVCANAFCILIFLGYAFFGGCVLLYLEGEHFERKTRDALYDRFERVVDALEGSSIDMATLRNDAPKRHALSHEVARRCLVTDAQPDAAQHEWNLKSAFLFSFGLLTTLGYGKVTPQTTSSRMFAVAWGLLGVPFAVIILSNIGLYLRSVERFIRKHIRKCRSHGLAEFESTMRETKHSTSSRLSVHSQHSDDGAAASTVSGVKSEWNVLPISLALFVLTHLTLGAIFLPWLNTSKFDFINGFYYCYICFTGMEYGALVNHENSYFPIVLVYNCVSLAMSTIVLNVSSTYAKKLYYCSRRVGDFAHAKIWIGSKHLRVKELLSALGQTIGVDPDTFQQLDLNQMIEDAILVKEGRLTCVPQAYTFLEGIWPPELVPLFLRDGSLPDYVDADDGRLKSGAITMEAKSSASKPVQPVQAREVFELTTGEANVLRAAIALSTFANGCLYRTLCRPTPVPAFQTADEFLSLTAKRKNFATPTSKADQEKSLRKKRRVLKCVEV